MRWSSFVINHKNFPFISRLQKFILSLFISSKNDLLSVCTCIHIYRYARSSWENVNLDVCFYVLIAMPLQSQESEQTSFCARRSESEQILNIAKNSENYSKLLKILNRIWALLKILNITVNIFNRFKKIITWNLLQMIFF